MNKVRSLIGKVTDPNAQLAEQQEAFTELVRTFQDMAYACAYAVLGDFYLAEDAAQEAFVSAWQKLNQLRHPEAFAGWFRRLILTECYRLTRRKRLRTVLLEEAVNDVADTNSRTADPQSILERDELMKKVFDAIRKLPESERIVVMLFYIEEHSQQDISTFLGVPLTTVAKRLYSARVHLRGMVLDGLKNDFAVYRPSRNKNFVRKVRAGIYDEYVGEYRFELRPELVVTIRREGDRLFSEGGGQINELFAKRGSESELHTREFDGIGKFVRDATGRISHFIYYEFGIEMGLARKIA